MTTRTPTEVAAALREEASYLDHEKVMAAWDRWRAYIAKGGKGSLPRDDFESLFDGVQEALVSGADTIDRLTAELERQRLDDWCRAVKALQTAERERDYKHRLYIEACGEMDKVWDALEKADYESGDEEPWSAVAKIIAERDELRAALKEQSALTQTAYDLTQTAYEERDAHMRGRTEATEKAHQWLRERDKAREQVDALARALEPFQKLLPALEHCSMSGDEISVWNGGNYIGKTTVENWRALASLPADALSTTPTRKEVMPHSVESRSDNATPPPSPSGAVSPEVDERAIIRQPIEMIAALIASYKAEAQRAVMGYLGVDSPHKQGWVERLALMERLESSVSAISNAGTSPEVEAVIRAARAWHEFDAEELDRDLHEAVAALPEEETP